jgi:hypothetical protein
MHSAVNERTKKQINSLISFLDSRFHGGKVKKTPREKEKQAKTRN